MLVSLVSTPDSHVAADSFPIAKADHSLRLQRADLNFGMHWQIQDRFVAILRRRCSGISNASASNCARAHGEGFSHKATTRFACLIELRFIQNPPARELLAQ